uniref:Uncharacterized protein n=1 Tax=Amphimedon queenslandica TaxID=400682 RepID=A0A1X7TKB5_AMPQE
MKGLGSLASQTIPQPTVIGVPSTPMTVGWGMVWDQQLFDDARDGNIEGMNTALSNGADINWSNTDVLNRTPLHIAAASNMSDAVQWLLSQGAAVDSRDDFGATPLIWAAVSGDILVVTMLLEKGADVTATTNAYLAFSNY